MGVDSNSQAKGGETPPVIPDHELLCVIGQGSYGKVWLARNSLGVFRAIKLVYRSAFDNQKPFDREWAGIKAFEPISRSHEGFMDILQVSINHEAGFFYYVMELGDDAVSGQKIDPARYRPKTLAGEIAERNRLPYQECLEMGLALSLALGEVHKHGLVHRDVKPSNIIYVNGVPKLADIGLVAPASEARSYVGTQGFIPPEGPGTPQADVYSLGKVLYEASTGKDRQDFPELPTQLGTMVREDRFLELNEVILRACHNDFKARYQTAWDLHAHLLVLANGKSVKRLNILERRLARLRSAAGVALAVLVALSAVGYHFWRQWRTGVRAQIDLAVAAANRAVDSGRLFDALASDVDALELASPGSDLETGLRLKVGSIFSGTPRLTLFEMESKPVRAAHWSRDGARIVVAGWRGEARVLDAASGRVLGAPIDTHRFLASAAFSPDGTRLVTTSETAPYCLLWDLEKRRDPVKFEHTTKVLCAAFSPDGKHIVTACHDHKVRIWNVETGDLERTLEGHTAPVVYCEFSHDGKFVATASRDQTARIWDWAGHVDALYRLDHHCWVYTTSFSPDDSRVVTAADDKHVRLWNLKNGGEKFPVEITGRKPLSTASFNPDGRFIVTGGYDGTVELWRASDMQRIEANSTLNLANPVIVAEFSPGGEALLVGGDDGSIRIWNFAGMVGPPKDLERVYCEDGSRFISVTNGSILVEESAGGSLVSKFSPMAALAEFPRLTENGTFAITVSTNPAANGTPQVFLQVWDADKGAGIGPGIKINGFPSVLALSRDGSKLAFALGADAETWDVARGAKLAGPVTHSGPVESAVFSPKGDRVASVAGRLALAWNPTNGALFYPPLTNKVHITCARFDFGGSQLVTCCADPQLIAYYAQTWNADTGAPLQRFDHTDGVLTASFDQAGDRIVTGGEDFFAFVWEIRSGRKLTRELVSGEKVKSIVFSDDAKWLASLSADQMVRIWDSWTGDPLTLPLRDSRRATRVGFIRGRKAIFSTDEQGHSRVWELPFDRTPVPILRQLARVVSGGTVDDYKAPPQTGEVPILAAWQSLKGLNPEFFSVSPVEVQSWREYTAVDCEKKEQWAAALFHLKILLATNPTDTSLPRRISHANRELEKQTSAAK